MELSFEECLQEKLRYVYHYLVKIGAKPEDAEDIVQDTAYKFLHYLDEIPVESCEGWLFKVAIHAYYDSIRMKTRRKRITSVFRIGTDTEWRTPESFLLEQELSEGVHTILAALKPHYREVLVMKYAMDLSMKEMAVLLERNENAIKSLLHRARDHFMTEYGRHAL